MRKSLLILTLISLLTVPTVMILAQNETAPNVNVREALDRITDLLFVLLLVIAVIFIILAAYNFVTAGGDPSKVDTARKNVMYALIGVGVAILAKGLVHLIKVIVRGY